jgi:hypothetical protein
MTSPMDTTWGEQTRSTHRMRKSAKLQGFEYFLERFSVQFGASAGLKKNNRESIKEITNKEQEQETGKNKKEHCGKN